MSELSYLNRKWNLEHQFEGEPEPRQWNLARPKLSTILAYTEFLEGKVRSRLDRHREAIGDAAYDRAIDRWAKGAITDDCGWHSKEFDASIHVEANCKELMWLWIQQAEADAPKDTKLTRRKLDELWAAKANECCRLMREMIYEKNPTHAPA